MMDRRKFLKWVSISGALPSLALASPTAPELLEKSMLTTENSAATYFEDECYTKISIVACGGAGIAMARHIDKATYGIHEIIAVDTSHRALKSAKNADKTLLIKSDEIRKPQSVQDAWNLAAENSDAIAEAIGQPHMAIILTGLGGAAGTGIANIVSMQARNQGVFTVALATQPFAFEQPIRQMTSARGLAALAGYGRTCTCVLPLQSIAEHVDPEAKFDSAFACIQEAVHHFLWNTAACLTHVGIVGIDFEDIRTVLSPSDWGVNSTSSIGWGEAQGHNRASLATHQALNHPFLLSGGNEFAHGIGVSIRASQKNLKMKQINAVMNIVKEQVCQPDTHVIFSADYDETLEDRMQVSILLHRLT